MKLYNVHSVLTLLRNIKYIFTLFPQVQRQRQARLHEQDMAQAAHEKWLQRNALLTEIETAVRNERQLHAKENRMRESKRREKTILEREILPGKCVVVVLFFFNDFK